MKLGRKNGAGIQFGAGLSGYCAELGAAFTAGHLGLACEPRTDHAPYIASWLRVLGSDPRAIITAASRAQAAADYLSAKADKTADQAAAPADTMDLAA